MTRLTRDEYGLKLAEAAALRADCTRRQVGAVIVAEDGSVVSTGYNGLAAGKPGCLSAGACPRGAMSYDDQPKDVAYEATGCRAVHAEANAIIRASRDRCIGATIYVSEEPCFGCSVLIEGAGIARVVTPGSLADEEATERALARQKLADAVLTAEIVVPHDNGIETVITPTGITTRTSGPLDPELVEALRRQKVRMEHEAAARRRAELAETNDGWKSL